MPGLSSAGVALAALALAAVAAQLDPDVEPALTWSNAGAIRQEIATVVPSLAGIGALRTAGDWNQPDGRHGGLETGFATASGRAAFAPVPVTETPPLQVIPRRAPPTDRADRTEVLVPHDDADRLGIQPGDPVQITTDTGQFTGRAQVVPMPAGAVQVCLPEAAALFCDPPAAHPVAATLTRGHA